MFSITCAFLADPAQVPVQIAAQPGREPEGSVAHHGVGQDEEAPGGPGLLLPGMVTITFSNESPTFNE